MLYRPGNGRTRTQRRDIPDPGHHVANLEGSAGERPAELKKAVFVVIT
jgi:hypothetical protein